MPEPDELGRIDDNLPEGGLPAGPYPGDEPGGVGGGGREVEEVQVPDVAAAGRKVMPGVGAQFEPGLVHEQVGLVVEGDGAGHHSAWGQGQAGDLDAGWAGGGRGSFQGGLIALDDWLVAVDGRTVVLESADGEVG